MTTTTHEPRAPADGGWFTSSRSNPLSECVEVNLEHPDGLVRIRDSKDCGAGPTISGSTTLRVSKAEWRAFLAGARVHEFDYSGMPITLR